MDPDLLNLQLNYNNTVREILQTSIGNGAFYFYLYLTGIPSNTNLQQVSSGWNNNLKSGSTSMNLFDFTGNLINLKDTVAGNVLAIEDFTTRSNSTDPSNIFAEINATIINPIKLFDSFEGGYIIFDPGFIFSHTFYVPNTSLVLIDSSTLLLTYKVEKKTDTDINVGVLSVNKFVYFELDVTNSTNVVKSYLTTKVSKVTTLPTTTLENGTVINSYNVELDLLSDNSIKNVSNVKKLNITSPIFVYNSLNYSSNTLLLNFTPLDSSEGSIGTLEANVELCFKTGYNNIQNLTETENVIDTLNFGQMKYLPTSSAFNNSNQYYVFGIIQGLNENQPRFYWPVIVDNEENNNLSVEFLVGAINPETSGTTENLNQKFFLYKFYIPNTNINTDNISDSINSDIYPPIGYIDFEEYSGIGDVSFDYFTIKIALGESFTGIRNMYRRSCLGNYSTLDQLYVYNPEASYLSDYRINGLETNVNQNIVKLIRRDSVIYDMLFLNTAKNLKNQRNKKINEYLSIISEQNLGFSNQTGTEESSISFVINPQKTLTLTADYRIFKSPYTIDDEGNYNFICYNEQGAPLAKGTQETTLGLNQKLYFNKNCNNFNTDEDFNCAYLGQTNASGTCISSFTEKTVNTVSLLHQRLFSLYTR